MLWLRLVPWVVVCVRLRLVVKRLLRFVQWVMLGNFPRLRRRFVLWEAPWAGSFWLGTPDVGLWLIPRLVRLVLGRGRLGVPRIVCLVLGCPRII